MKIKFIDKEIYWLVEEDGIDTDKVHYETIGLIPKVEMCLKIDNEFSGILELDVIKQILNFMESFSK